MSVRNTLWRCARQLSERRLLQNDLRLQQLRSMDGTFNAQSCNNFHYIKKKSECSCQKHRNPAQCPLNASQLIVWFSPPKVPSCDFQGILVTLVSCRLVNYVSAYSLLSFIHHLAPKFPCSHFHRYSSILSDIVRHYT